MKTTSWTYYRNGKTFTPWPNYRRWNWPVIGLLAGVAEFWLAVIWFVRGI